MQRDNDKERRRIRRTKPRADFKPQPPRRRDQRYRAEEPKKMEQNKKSIFEIMKPNISENTNGIIDIIIVQCTRMSIARVAFKAEFPF